MAKLSQNISTLVFRRNIPYKFETYVLNCDMLQVLVEMDGIKDVAAIAANLNKPVGDLVTTFATLYQQKLIFLVKPNPTIVTQPDSLEKSSEKLNPIGLSQSEILPGQQQPNQPAQSKNTSQVMKKKASISVTHGNKHKPSPNPLSYEPIEFTQKGGNAQLPKSRLNGVSFRLNSSKPKNNKHVLNVAKPKNLGFHQAGDVELTYRRAEQGLQRKKGAVLPGSDQAEDYPNDKAIEFFEKGLAYLQRRSYKEALRQFEITLKLDPNNRICRANIQRIRKLLKTDNYENFKRTQ